SSRRRHTRFSRDWSSDVCSSDLLVAPGGQVLAHEVGPDRQLPVPAVDHDRELHGPRPPVAVDGVEGRPDRAAGEDDVVDQHDHRSEERRAGEEWRFRWPWQYDKT